MARVNVTPGTILWTLGKSRSEWHTFLADDSGSEGVWAPSVAGAEITVLAAAPVGTPVSPTFEIDRIAVIQPSPQSTYCYRDARCYTESDFKGIEAARAAVAHIEFAKDGGYYMCSGALISDMANRDSLFLTANHCISTSAQAASVEALWDNFSNACGGSVNPGTRTSGADLVATSSFTDVTLLRMRQLPAGRWSMGWDSRPSAVSAGTQLFRISQPGFDDGSSWYVQSFSRSSVDTGSVTCTGVTRPSFIYSRAIDGGTGGGSSGAPAMTSGGYIVGQLYGKCGPNTDNCSAANATVDGALSESWPVVASFINNGSPAQPQPCNPTATTLCLNSARFAIAVAWRDFSGNTGSGTAVSMTADTGYFWFFNQANVELVIKVLDARAVNGKFWVFYGALSNVEYTITVRDMQTGATKTYFNPSGTFASKGDVAAF